MKKEIVSVIIPVYNELDYIKPALLSIIQQQKTSFDIEILIIDGGSDDGTLDLIKDIQLEHSEIQLFQNPERNTPVALNIGIQASKGEYIAILGTHAVYAENYIETCLRELYEKDAAGCSGRVIMAKDDQSYQSLLIYYLLTSSFGVSSTSYRTIQEGYGEHCPFGIYKKSVFGTVGLYNETLIRNQDNDMSFRIRQAGLRLYYTFKTSAFYYPKKTIRTLLSYAANSGMANAISLYISPYSMSLRHFIPVVFLTSTLFMLIASLFFYLLNHIQLAEFSTYICIIVFIIHLFIGSVISGINILKTRKYILLVLPFVFLSFHLAYGYGTLTGLIKYINKKYIND